MRVHARSQSEEAAIDPRATLHFAAALVRPQVQQRAGTLSIEEAELPGVRMPATQLCQLLVNLLSNAAHALERSSPDRRIELRAHPKSGGLEVSIHDTGRGMTPEQLARLGHDRFTTKAPGEGTGLGVAICRELTTQAGGTLTIDSHVGKGTTVTLWLPGEETPVAG
jgi:signal transduction histidine kinase